MKQRVFSAFNVNVINPLSNAVEIRTIYIQKMYLTNIYSKVYFPLKARLIKLTDRLVCDDFIISLLTSKHS
jgi:hypothetical protein